VKTDEIKIGDILYIQSEAYIGHGEDDIAGGLATVSETGKWPNGICYVCFEEVGNHKQYNLEIILEKQKEFAEKYAGRTAHPMPDYNDYGERW
jgi:hypothetical protein